MDKRKKWCEKYPEWFENRLEDMSDFAVWLERCKNYKEDVEYSTVYIGDRADSTVICRTRKLYKGSDMNGIDVLYVAFYNGSIVYMGKSYVDAMEAYEYAEEFDI